MSDYEITLSASEIHEYALGHLRRLLKMPKGVRYPDGFVAGRGEWATPDRPILKLVPFSEESVTFPGSYSHYMGAQWMFAGHLILMDYRFVEWGSYLNINTFEYKRPGLVEGSGAGFCFRQSKNWSLASQNEPIVEYDDYEAHKSKCQSLGLSEVSEREFEKMYDFIRKSYWSGRMSYPQKSVAKTFEDSMGRINKAGPWSWMDFESYCEELTFGSKPWIITEDELYKPFDDCKAELLTDSGSAWKKSVHAGQITRIILETTAMSPDVLDDQIAVEVMALAAMLSISRGGDREMYRKMDAYFSGKTPYRSNGRRGRRW